MNNLPTFKKQAEAQVNHIFRDYSQKEKMMICGLIFNTLDAYHALVMSKIPKESKAAFSGDESDYLKYFDSGFNACRAEFTSNINQ